MKIGIVIPTYNEATNIQSLLKLIEKETSKIKDCSFTVVVVDDNSPDNTAKIAKKTFILNNSNSFKLNVIIRKVKDGYGKACIVGMDYLLKCGVDFILTMDADLSHNPKYIKNFVDASKAHDLIIGSRYVNGGQTPDWTFRRKMLSKYGNFYTRILLGNNISDYTGGYNMYSVDLLKKVSLNNIKSTGYGFLIELKYKTSKLAKKVYQVPIIFHDRKNGKSKIPKSTLIKNFFLVPKLLLDKGFQS